jgi:hypothetical protein
MDCGRDEGKKKEKAERKEVGRKEEKWKNNKGHSIKEVYRTQEREKENAGDNREENQ